MPRLRTETATRRKPRAALLSRVSTSGQNLHAQTEQLRGEAVRRGYEVVCVEEHVGTGRRVDRPGQARLQHS